jgi:site-specific recombinase XerD
MKASVAVFVDEETKFNVQYEKHLRALKLQGMSKRTIECYSRSLRRIFAYFNRVPDKLLVSELQQYFSDLVDTHSWSTVKIDRSALQFYWKYVLERKWRFVEIVKPPQIRRIPDILTIGEVSTLLSHIELLRFRVVLFGIYSMGLRISEGVSLRVCDIDKHTMQVHIRNGKGHKDRLVPMPYSTYNAFKKYWIVHRNPKLIFPNILGGTETVKHTLHAMNIQCVQAAFRAGVLDSKINKKVSVHSLRHSYATHLLEANVNLRVVQKILGHARIETTTRYTHFTKETLVNSDSIINNMVSKIHFHNL